MMIVIETQYLENYGSAEKPYWKFKGGSCYKITGVPLNIDYYEVVQMVKDEVEYKNDFSEQYILNWTVESDDYLSWFEKSQLEYDGEIVHKEPEIEYAELNERYVA
jgi:hypothetical protein